MPLNLAVELDRRQARTQSRLDRMRLLECFMLYNNWRLHNRLITWHVGIAYQTNLLKKYLD